MKTKYKAFLYAFIILTVALYLRLDYVICSAFEFKIDAWSMYNYALNVVKGEYYGHCFGEHWARYAYWPPVYIFLSGFVYRFFGVSRDFLVMRFVQAAFSSLSCLLAGLIAGETVKPYSKFFREAGLAAGLLTALNPSMVVYTNHLYAETVFITVYLAVIYMALKYVRCELAAKLCGLKTGRRYLICFSVLLGVGILTRPVLLPFPILLFVFACLYAALRKHLKKAFRIIAADTAILIAIALFVMSPWIIRNYVLTGRFILVDTNGPVNFYIAHNPRADGQWVDVKPQTDIDMLYETGYRDGLLYIARNIKEEIRLLVTKQKLFITGEDPHITEAKASLDRVFSISILGKQLKLPQITYNFLLGVSAALLLMFIIKLTSLKKLYILVSEFSWILLNFLYVNTIILIFYFAPRYRIIAEPLLCIVCGISAAGLLSIRSEEIY